MTSHELSLRDHVPGTIHLVELEASEHDTKGHIVLHPQPSADPEDPLNWSRKRKLWNIGMVYAYILGVGIPTTVQYSILTNISEETGIPLADLNTGTGLMFLFAGWGCLFWQPIALTYGRRGVYVISSLLCIPPMVWTAYTTSTGAWYAHRILIGFFVAPVESLPEVSVPDLFFAHERGNYMGLYCLFLFGSNALAPLLAGFIANSLGWRAAIWFGTIVAAVGTIVVFFCMEETIYFRSAVEGVNSPAETAQAEVVGEKSETKVVGEQVISESTSPAASDIVRSPPRTYWQKLALFRLLPQRPSNKQMLIMMVRPLMIFFFFPNVDWSGFLYGASLCLYQVGNGTVAFILGGAPYHFSSSMVGLSYTAGLIGSLLGWAYAGWLADKVTLYLARRNKGVREPEQRLWILVPSGLVAAAGLILWGVGAAHRVHWMGLMFGLAMFQFGIVVGATTSLAYNVDCFKEIAGETLILVIVIRNTMGYGMAYGITPWINASGVQNTFIGTAFLFIGCTCSFLIMTVWGKRFRKMCAKKYWHFVDTLIVASH
ncbi:hypothetical protein PV04_01513 [Phialophora macrospora]|uniref:Major facilitator superfamily (MFS) profile domain-containing protein n=1 Tax=Phialophora macrospora TaxID=1851006 RepID=A0A0D2D736_9EURO|nr:hypothetical protein PV04_01513 [Phialophora macrospora]